MRVGQTHIHEVDMLIAPFMGVFDGMLDGELVRMQFDK